jgi:hypothetical protein
MAVIDAMHIDRASLFQFVSSMIKETGWFAPGSSELKNSKIIYTNKIANMYA